MLHLSKLCEVVSASSCMQTRDRWETVAFALGWCNVYQHGASDLQAVQQDEPTDQVVGNA